MHRQQPKTMGRHGNLEGVTGFFKGPLRVELEKGFMGVGA